MATLALLAPLAATAPSRVKLDARANYCGVPLRSRVSAPKVPAAASRSTCAFSLSPVPGANPRYAFVVPSKRNDVGKINPSKPRGKVVAGAGGMTLTCPTVCFAVAAVMVLLKNADVDLPFEMPALDSNLLMAVGALSIPAAWLASFSSQMGLWVAFVGMLLKKFMSGWPAVLEPVLWFLLLGITTPAQVLAWRVSKWALLVNMVLCIYLGYQHISADGVSGAIKGKALVGTLALAVLVVCSVVMCPITSMFG